MFFFSWWDSIWHLLLGLSDIYYSQAQCRAINLVSNIGDYLVHNINTMQCGGADLIYKSKLFLFLLCFLQLWVILQNTADDPTTKHLVLKQCSQNSFTHVGCSLTNFHVILLYFLINFVAILSCPAAYLQLISRKYHSITK